MPSTHSERAHSSIGASSAHRWMLCPGSVKLLEQNPMPSSDVADEGTKAHELSELLLLDKEVNYSEYTPEMLELIREYVDWVRSLMGALKRNVSKGGWPSIAVEQQFQLKSVSDHAFGTNDVAVYVDYGPLHIIDLKYGHKYVEVEENVQLMYYALGVIEELNLEPTEVVLWIYGPRMTPDQPARKWECPMKRLKEFKKEVIAAAKRVEENPDLYVPGDDQCFYCNKAACPEVTKRQLAMFDDINELGPEVLPGLQDMSTEDLAARLKMKDILEGAFRDIAGILKSRAEAGEEVPGYKLVRSFGNRTFRGDVDTQQIVKLGLPKEDLFEEPKRKSPSKVETLLKKKYPARKKEDKEKRDAILKKFNALVERPDRGLSLVGSDQPGDPVLPAPFDDVEVIDAEFEEVLDTSEFDDGDDVDLSEFE